MPPDDDDHPDDTEPAFERIPPEALEPWQMAIYASWLNIGHRVLHEDAGPKLSIRAIGRECEMLAAVAAWFHHHGNITHAAARLGASRRAIRGRLERWYERYPDLVPEEVKGKTLFKVIPAKSSASTTTPNEPERTSDLQEGVP